MKALAVGCGYLGQALERQPASIDLSCVDHRPDPVVVFLALSLLGFPSLGALVALKEVAKGADRID
ncbi:MAG: hypothetical protein M0D54_10375 [Hyphomonadaceae bacterium JAD_PAG50586_4]|nr:MAG: hypothetical protein M0D54_10375 [Hyphomonadaceae bacterium JAD_PAG50586_4]